MGANFQVEILNDMTDSNENRLGAVADMQLAVGHLKEATFCPDIT